MKKTLIALLCACILFSFSGCFELVPKEDILEITESTAVTTEEQTEATTEEATTEATTQAQATKAQISDADAATLKDMTWSDMALSIDGVFYDLPVDYNLFAQNGWTFDIADYGYEDGYVLNSGAEVYMTIHLENEEYDSDIVVGFRNDAQEVKDITECVVPDMQISIHFADTYPDVVLPGLITWGSTLEEVVAAYGEEYNDEPYRSDDLKYTVYEYSLDYTTSIRLVIHDERGLIDFTLKQ